MTLIKWIELGTISASYTNVRNHRRWLNEERGRIPMIDRVNYPNAGIDCRLSRRGWIS